MSSERQQVAACCHSPAPASPPTPRAPAMTFCFAPRSRAATVGAMGTSAGPHGEQGRRAGPAELLCAQGGMGEKTDLAAVQGDTGCLAVSAEGLHLRCVETGAAEHRCVLGLCSCSRMAGCTGRAGEHCGHRVSLWCRSEQATWHGHSRTALCHPQITFCSGESCSAEKG